MQRKSPALLILGLVSVLIFAACGKGAEEGATDGFADADTMSVGLIAPMTGPFAVLGISQRNSVEVIINQINADGGIGGAQLKLESRDSGLDPGKAVQQANELAGDKNVKMVIGPSLTSFYNAAKGAFEQNKMINCQPAVAAGSFAELDYGFRSQDPNDIDVDKMLAYLQDEGKESIGLVFEDDDTGEFFDKEFTKKAPKYGLEYLGWQTTREDDTSYVSYLQKLSDADAIWISTNPVGAKAMAAKEPAGYDGLLIGGSGLFNIEFPEAAGESIVGTVFASANYDWLLRDKSQWQPGYKKHIDAVVDEFGINKGPKTGATSPKGTGMAADCVFAYAQAAEDVQSTDSDEVVGAIEKLDVDAAETPSGNGIKPGKNHEFYGIDDIHLYQWQHDDDGWYATELEQ